MPHNARDIQNLKASLRMTALPLLSKEAEHELFVKLRAATDEDTKHFYRDQILRANLRFCFKMALHSSRVSALMTSEAYVSMLEGLLKAIERFDHTRGVKFISYAVWWMRQQFTLDNFAHNDIVRMPANIHTDIVRYKRLNRRAINAGLMPPTIPAAMTAVPLMIMSPEGDEMERSEIYDLSSNNTGAVLDSLHAEDVKKTVEKCLSVLPERSAEVLRLIYGIGDIGEHTLKDISTKMKLSRERVRQIHEQSLRIIAKNSEVNKHTADFTF